MEYVANDVEAPFTGRSSCQLHACQLPAVANANSCMEDFLPKRWNSNYLLHLHTNHLLESKIILLNPEPGAMAASLRDSTLVQMMNSGQYSDMSLSCNGEIFKVHKAVVVGQSDVIKAAAEGNFRVSIIRTERALFTNSMLFRKRAPTTSLWMVTSLLLSNDWSNSCTLETTTIRTSISTVLFM